MRACAEHEGLTFNDYVEKSGLTEPSARNAWLEERSKFSLRDKITSFGEYGAGIPAYLNFIKVVGVLFVFFTFIMLAPMTIYHFDWMNRCDDDSNSSISAIDSVTMDAPNAIMMCSCVFDDEPFDDPIMSYACDKSLQPFDLDAQNRSEAISEVLFHNYISKSWG